MDSIVHTLKEQLASQQKTLAEMMSQIQAQNQIIQNQGQLFQNKISQLCKSLSQRQSVESNLRGQLPIQSIENPKRNLSGVAHPPNAPMVHTQESSSQGSQIEELKEITRFRMESLFQRLI